MEHIHVMHSQQVDILLDKRHREKMARAVEVHTTPGESRGISNADSGQQHTAALRLLFISQSLAERLDAIEHTCSRTTHNGDALLIDSQSIAFSFLHLGGKSKFNVSHLFIAFLTDGQQQARLFLKIRLQELSLLLQTLGSKNLHAAVQHKGLALLQSNLLRHRHHVVVHSI